MSLTLKSNESLITQCQLGEFNATLTNARLIITSLTSEENFPLRGISGVGIYDDVDKYANDVVKEKAKHRENVLRIAAGIGIVLLFICVSQNEYSIGFVALIIGFLISSDKKSAVKLQTILLIMQHGGNRDFRFNKKDTSAAVVKKFVDQVNETLT